MIGTTDLDKALIETRRPSFFERSFIGRKIRPILRTLRVDREDPYEEILTDNMEIITTDNSRRFHSE